MSSEIGTSGGNKTIAAITVGTSGGNKAVLIGTVGTSSGNKVFFSALSVSAAPVNADGIGGVANINTSASTATASGGIGPFTYLWTKVSGDNITINNATLATTTFRGSLMASPEVRNATFICTVTDTATGLSAPSNNVFARVERT